MREDKTSVETKAESGAALGVPPGRSNFARKNAPCQDSIITREKFSTLNGLIHRISILI